MPHDPIIAWVVLVLADVVAILLISLLMTRDVLTRRINHAGRRA